MGLVIRGLIELRDELRRAIEAARSRKKRGRDDDRRSPKRDQPKRQPRREGGGFSAPFNLSGDHMFGIEISQGRTTDEDSTGQSPADCKKLGNDKFSQKLFLQCRCKRGDAEACRALSRFED